MDRAVLAERFLARSDWAEARREALAGDASARRYERLSLPDGRTAILMDAPTEGGQDIAAFLRVARYLAAEGFSAPQVYQADTETGFAILEDFGDALYARLLDAGNASENGLYCAAVDLLLELQSKPCPPFLTVMSPEMWAAQLEPLFDWYCARLSGPVAPGLRTAIEAELCKVLTRYDTGRTVMVLRDFHAENLIWLPDREGVRRVGMLDFQDALGGAPVYDLVSLLQDARRDVSRGTIAAMKARFLAGSGLSEDGFGASYAAFGALRNLRILGIFARLAVALGKPGYVDLMPRVWGYVAEDLRHSALSRLSDLLRECLPEPGADALARLRAA